MVPLQEALQHYDYFRPEPPRCRRAYQPVGQTPPVAEALLLTQREGCRTAQMDPQLASGLRWQLTTRELVEGARVTRPWVCTAPSLVPVLAALNAEATAVLSARSKAPTLCRQRDPTRWGVVGLTSGTGIVARVPFLVLRLLPASRGTSWNLVAVA